MKNEKQINIEELAHILVDLKFENNNLINEYNELSKELKGNEEFPNKYFLEYLIFDLFTDNACFLLAFDQKTSLSLFKIYLPNIIVKLIQRGYRFDWQEFEDLFKKRAQEYQQQLREYDPEYLKKIDINSYLPGLGKSFSINLVGYKSPPLILKAHVKFVMKLKHFYGKFLKDIMKKYEIVP